MFLGHFAAAAVGSRLEPRLRLGTALVAAQLPDVLWPVFLLAGVENATIAPGVYDLLYERGYWNGSSSTLPYVQRAASTSVFPNGSVALERPQ